MNCTRGDAFQLYYPIGLEIRDLPDSKIKAFYCLEQEKIIVNEIFESGKRDQGGVSGNETCVALSFESP